MKSIDHHLLQKSALNINLIILSFYSSEILEIDFSKKMCGLSLSLVVYYDTVKSVLCDLLREH